MIYPNMMLYKIIYFCTVYRKCNIISVIYHSSFLCWNERYLFRRMPSISIQTILSAGAYIDQISPKLVGWQTRVFIENVISYLLHEPIERLAIHFFLQGKLLGDIAHINKSCQWLPCIKVFLVLRIKPGFNNSPRLKHCVNITVGT